jgi:ABC-type amino acid transport system permease subunit
MDSRFYGNDNQAKKETSSMANSTIALLLFIGVIFFLLAGIIYAITNKDKKNLQRSGSFASMAVFHDMQSGEKQKAIETVIEQQAEKKWEEEESGEGKESYVN